MKKTNLYFTDEQVEFLLSLLQERKLDVTSSHAEFIAENTKQDFKIRLLNYVSKQHEVYYETVKY